LGGGHPYCFCLYVSSRIVLTFVRVDQWNCWHRKILDHFCLLPRIFRCEYFGPFCHVLRWEIRPKVVSRQQDGNIELPPKNLRLESRPCLSLVLAFIVLALSGSLPFVKSAFSHDQKSFLWKIQSGSATVYLLGSIHLLKKNVYPLNETIENTYESSDTLVVEANINEMDKLDLTKLTGRAFYQGDDHIEKHVSPETYRSIRKESETLGLPVELIRMQKPWFLALALQAMELVKLGYDPQYGVDFHFLAKARGKKRILELESVEEQINLLSGFSEREQELFLLYTLKNLRSMDGQVEALVRAWASGDVQAIESILTESALQDKAIAPVFGKLFDERNLKMCSRIESYLNSTGSYFVIVGAGHLVGKRGIIELIKGKGYVAEQL
jgi:uncharacterized protein YbaP (TraB family)